MAGERRLGRSGGPLGELWGPSGGRLGPLLGAHWGNLGAVRGRLRRLGGLLGRLGGPWDHLGRVLGTILGPRRAILEAMRQHEAPSGLFWAILGGVVGPIWAENPTGGGMDPAGLGTGGRGRSPREGSF